MFGFFSFKWSLKLPWGELYFEDKKGNSLFFFYNISSQSIAFLEIAHNWIVWSFWNVFYFYIFSKINHKVDIDSLSNRINYLINNRFFQYFFKFLSSFTYLSPISEDIISRILLPSNRIISLFWRFCNFILVHFKPHLHVSPCKITQNKWLIL